MSIAQMLLYLLLFIISAIIVFDLLALRKGIGFTFLGQKISYSMLLELGSLVPISILLFMFSFYWAIPASIVSMVAILYLELQYQFKPHGPFHGVKHRA